MATIFNTANRTSRFIPEIWLSSIFEAIDASLVVGSSLVVNRDYEGEIQNAGDTVRIPTVVDPTTALYDPLVGFTTDPQEPVTGSLTFEIEIANSFRFRLEDITKVQSQIGSQLMDHGTTRAGRKLAEYADAYVANKLVAAVPSGTRMIDLDLAAANDVVYKQIIGAKVELDKTNTPQDGRFMIISPDLYGVLLNDNRFIDASRYASDAPIKNGEVGRILGFTVVSCNVMPSAPSVVHMIAGHNIATTYADQLTEIEFYRPEKFFADAVRGLHVFGAKVMRPEHLVIGKAVLP